MNSFNSFSESIEARKCAFDNSFVSEDFCRTFQTMKFLILPVAIAFISITSIDCEPVLESDLSRYCFHAAIVIGVKKYAVSPFESDKTCSGAIISSTQIVTTFDCTRHAIIPSYYIYPSNITVRAGSADRLSGGIVRYTKEVKRFDVGRGHYLAVITLDEPLVFGPTVCKIDMAREKDDKVYMKMRNSVEVCGYRMFSDFGRVRQLEAITSTIAHINPKCPVFHYVHRRLAVHGGQIFVRATAIDHFQVTEHNLTLVSLDLSITVKIF